MDWWIQVVLLALCPFTLGVWGMYAMAQDQLIPKDFEMLLVLTVVAGVVLAVMFEKRKGKKS